MGTFQKWNKANLKTFTKDVWNKLHKIYIERFYTYYSSIQDDFLFMTIDTRFYLFAAIGILSLFPWWKTIKPIYKTNIMSILLMLVKYILLACLFILCYASLADNSYNPFIYFRF